jgi:hypothetical protein
VTAQTGRGLDFLWPAVEPEGIFVSEFERGEIGPDLFRQACKFGLEGLLEAQGSAVPRRPIAELDQGEEPQSSGNAKGPGDFFMTDKDAFDLCVEGRDLRRGPRAPRASPTLAALSF